MSQITRVKLLPHQKDFLEAKNIPFVGICGGLGSGKTTAGILYLIQTLIENRANVAMYEPTYKLCNDVAVPKITELLNTCNITYKHNKTENNFYTDYGILQLRSYEDPNKIIGTDIVGACIDELDTIPVAKAKQVVANVSSRIRVPNKHGFQLRFVFSPEGLKFGYEFFVENANENKKLIKASTYSNIFLPDSYTKNDEDKYSENQIKAYRNGEFVNLSGERVWDFDRDLHGTDRVLRAGDNRLYVGQDFNITKMCSSIAVIENATIYVIDEIYNAHDTRQTISILRDRYDGRKITIVPDASGRNRSTSSTWTDEQLLRKHYTIASNTINPFIRDRVDTANEMFRKGMLKINVAKAKHLAKAFENQIYATSGMPAKTGDDNATDGCTYLSYHYRNIDKSGKREPWMSAQALTPDRVGEVIPADTYVNDVWSKSRRGKVEAF